MRARWLMFSLVGVGLPMIAAVATARADYVTIYGGPTFSPGVGGYQNPTTPRTTADNGVAVCYAEKYVASGGTGHDAALRWDASGAAPVVLQTLSTFNGDCHVYVINPVDIAGGTADQFDSTGHALGTRAVRWDASGAVTELGNLGTDSNGNTLGEVDAINAAGTAVGYMDKFTSGGASLGYRAVRWDASGTIATELGNLGFSSAGTLYSQAYAINFAGTVVGYVSKGALGNRAVRWNAGSTLATELDNLGTDSTGATSSNTSAINDAGIAAGYANKYSSSGAYLGDRAVRWAASGTAIAELGSLGSDPTGFSGAAVAAINSTGTIVGEDAKYSGSGTYLGYRAVRWDASSTTATELGNLGTSSSGIASGDALAINSSRLAVGYVEKYDAAGDLLGDRAVAWGGDGSLIDLNSLIDPASGWTLNIATAISDTNWVTGVGSFDPDGPGGQAPYDRAFLLQFPVPEPSCMCFIPMAVAATKRRGRPK